MLVATFANRTASASLRLSRRFPPGEFNRTPETSFPASFAVLIAALSVSASPSMISPLKRMIVLLSFVATLLRVAAEMADGMAPEMRIAPSPAQRTYFRSQIESVPLGKCRQLLGRFGG